MSGPKTILEQNSELADKIYREARNNPKSPYAGKCVGIANGQVVVVADDLDEMVRRLLEIEPDPRKTFCLDTNDNDEEVIEIWSCS